MVSSRELRSSHPYGLEEGEITQMLQDSFSHAREDMQARALREQQVEADRMIEDLQAALQKDGAELLDEEYQCLEVALKELAQVRASSTSIGYWRDRSNR